MIDASHFSAIGFTIFVSLVAYKRFFGLSDFLEKGIQGIQSNIKQAEEDREMAAIKLSEAQSKLIDLDKLVSKMEEDSKKTLKTLINHKMQELNIFEESLAKRHEKMIEELEHQYARKYRDEFTHQLITELTTSLSEQNSPEDNHYQLECALQKFTNASDNIKTHLSYV